MKFKLESSLDDAIMFLRNLDRGPSEVDVSEPVPSEFRKPLLLRGRYTPRQRHALSRARAIELNYAWGWDEGDIGFLEEAREMRSLSILSHKLLDLSPLNNLAKLERLSIQCRTSSDVHIDRHTNLEYLALDCSPKFKGLFDCKSLKSLDLFYFSDKDAQRLGQLGSLRTLELAQCRLETVAGIERLVGLTGLALNRMPHLTDFGHISELASLQRLEMRWCPKLVDMSFISSLKNLTALRIADNREIESLAPVADCPNLKYLYLGGSTVVKDGKVGFLRDLPNLKDFAYANRRHYDDRN